MHNEKMQDEFDFIEDRIKFVVNTDYVASRIYECIQNSQLSYGELSKITGIAKSAIHRYATRQVQKIPKENIEKIAKATGVTVHWLLGLDGLPDKAEQSELSEREENINRLLALTDEEWEKVDAFVQGLLANR